MTNGKLTSITRRSVQEDTLIRGAVREKDEEAVVSESIQLVSSGDGKQKFAWPSVAPLPPLKYIVRYKLSTLHQLLTLQQDRNCHPGSVSSAPDSLGH